MATDLTGLRGELEDAPTEVGESLLLADTVWKRDSWTGGRAYLFVMTPKSEWQTPECVLHRFVSFPRATLLKKIKKETHKLIKTSPGPGSGISSSTILVEISPGLS